jgi:four helix bundle protein
MNPMTFEDLDSWKHARELVSKIYRLTRSEPLCRDFGICTQLQRAGVSIMSNIAEGFERTHISEKVQFYNVARGSTGEVRSLLYVVEDNFPKWPRLLLYFASKSFWWANSLAGLFDPPKRENRGPDFHSPSSRS